jgi:PAS domain-containing protein
VVTKIVLRLRPLPSPQPPPAQSPHVVDLGDHARAAVASTSLSRWSAAVAAAHDPCLLLDREGRIISISASAAALLGCHDGVVVGRPLLDVVDVVDFETGASGPDYAVRIAPLAVLAPDAGIVRALLRVRLPGGARATIDTAAAPLRDARGEVLGSMAFLAAVGGG